MRLMVGFLVLNCPRVDMLVVESRRMCEDTEEELYLCRRCEMTCRRVGKMAYECSIVQ
jgi:hypothetical protein